MGYFSSMTSSPRLITRPHQIKKLRLKALMTQGMLAQKATVHVATVRMAEDGPKQVFPGTVKKLANALGCDPSDISEVVSDEQEAVGA
jgi:DNA-binding Xre family transcriptional regulator